MGGKFEAVKEGPMGHPVELGHLESGQWQRLQDCADRLEKAWQELGPEAEAVDLATLLPTPDDSMRPVILQELIKTDLEIRWRRGRGIPLDRYLEKYLEL